ncbi:MAG: hypothetical protein VX747_04695 [Actinomycetota bacterium]|nr:hypothetical protein [Actinomycetota bacterium]
MAKATLPTLKIEDLKSEATKSLYAGAGVVDLAVETVREYVSDVQKKLVDLQKDATTRFEGVQKSVKDFDFEPKTIRTQVETVVNARVEALSDEAKARRTAIEKRVAELQGEAKALPVTVRKQLDETTATATATYADLAKRGEVLVGRIRKQESTQATKTAAKTTTAKAKTTKTQGTKTAKTAAKKTTTGAKKSATTAKKSASSAAPTAKKSPAKKSATATKTAAKKTATAAATATTEAAQKVGD